ncbi:S8 family peptidase [Streptomyces sp. AK04-3B]|uniref:S8 family peptidase n=1 Tax=Streptomyces sp. AK04-3B TaxID=3028650 RepID=UPI0029B94F3E|nr:S8 family serine peptidase [Streptomyces sp. AK04-3B]MDX3800414.1 S8 family serine peptidase [Streptomyces sp. AK04-3B]
MISNRTGGSGAALAITCVLLLGVGPAPTAVAAARVVATPSQRVIVVMRDQHPNLLSRAGSAQRASALDTDQLPLMRALKDSGARSLSRLKTVNAVTATVSPAERARLAADPDVAAVVPDRRIPDPRTGTARSAAWSAVPAVGAAGLCPKNPDHPLVEPEALHLTKADAAQPLATGKGVKVAFWTDGIDVNNPEFVRPDGSRVVTAVRDFTGDGNGEATGGGEGFGDAGAIAAQGARTYDMAQELPYSGLPKGCTFRIKGFAPDADLVALKVWGRDGGWLSQMARSIDDAVWKEKADVINVGTAFASLPDTPDDPIRMAVHAAVAAGVTVVTGSGDSGTSGTVAGPGGDPDVITVGATAAFRLVGQAYGYRRYASDNITALSSGGTAQGNRLVDLVAPGQAGMAPCTVDPRWTDCTQDTLAWGGTSQSAPFVAGATADVIQAYKRTHQGKRPAPDLVKRLLTGTATDLNAPADEQGAGLLNTEAAVRAALGTGGLVPSAAQLNVTGAAGSSHNGTVRLTNTGTRPERVTMTSRAVGAETFRTDRTVTVGDPQDTSAPEGALAAPPVTFDVPSGTPLLNAEMAWPGTADSGQLALFLVDPHGRLTQMSYDYDHTDYQHVDVHAPVPGTWTAKVVWNNGRGLLQDPPEKPGTYRGQAKLRFSGRSYTSAGVPEQTRTIPAGGTADFDVHLTLPKQAGDAPASLRFDAADGTRLSVPVARRTLLGDSFTATITGGVGRGVGQILGYDIDVPPGHQSLTVDLTAQDPDTSLDYYLVDPDGQIPARDTNLTGTEGRTPTAAANLTADQPAAGRWRLLVVVPGAVSGKDISETVSGRVRYDAVRITSVGLPDDPAHTLAQGGTVTATVSVTNTTPAGRYLFLDPRLDKETELTLTPTDGSATMALPYPNPAYWRVPRHTNLLTASGTANQPTDMEMAHAPTVAPDIVGFAGPGNKVTASLSASQVTPGDWYTQLTPAGPYGDTTPPKGTGHVTLTACTRAFDPAVTSATGDFWEPGATVKPVFVASGDTVTLTVRVKPAAASGTTVRGVLFVETYSPGVAERAGSELTGIRYAYTVG